MIELILWFIILVCLFGIGRIIWTKFPLAKIVKPETIPETHQDVKKKLLEKRLERKLVSLGKWSKDNILPQTSWVKNLTKSTVGKVKNLEQDYRRKLLKHSFVDQVSKQEQVIQKLKQASQFLAGNEVGKAEQLYLEVIALDAHNLQAFSGLGEVYRRQKNYDQAKEVFEFILKLNDHNPLAYLGLADVAEAQGDLMTASKDYQAALELDSADTSTYLALAKIYQSMEKYEEAQETIKAALKIDSSQPVLLDFLIEISIILHDKETALMGWKHLEEVNPENQKLPELKDKIKKIKR